MPILEEEKKRFFSFLDSFLKEKSEIFELADFKTEGGTKFPKEAFLYVPDVLKPSTWKLRIWETPESKVTVAQLGRASAAFSSGGFRGNTVKIPADELGNIKSKLISLYKKEGVSKEQIPSHLLEEEGGVDNMPDSKILEDVDVKIKALSDSFELKSKELEDSYNKKLVDTEKKLTETHAKELETANKRLEDYEKRLSEKDGDLHKERVEKTCNALITSGVWPAVVEKAKFIMLADVPGKFASIKLDENTEKSLSEVLTEVLEAIPTESRISFEDLSHQNKNVDPNKKFLSDVEVDSYAKENKLSYQEACSKLAKEGKIDI